MEQLINKFYDAKFSGKEKLATKLQIQLCDKLREFDDVFGCDPITYSVERISDLTAAVSTYTELKDGDYSKEIRDKAHKISTYTRIIDFVHYLNTL